MKVERIVLHNFKKHEHLELDVNGRNIFLLGPNEAGKSSILDSIFFALNPAKETPETRIPRPLKAGAKAGSVEITVGGADGKEYKVTRKFTEGSEDRKLTIVSSEGGTTTKVEMLQSLIGYKSVNPFEFVEWSTTAEGRRKQLALIESLLPASTLTVLNEIKYQIAVYNEKLQKANTDKLSLDRSLKGLGVTEHDLLVYNEPIDVSEEIGKLDEVQRYNSERGKNVSKKETAEHEIIGMKNVLADLEARVADTKAAITKKVDEKVELEKWISEHPLRDEGSIRARINEAQAHNSKNTLVKKHADTCVELADAEKEHLRLKGEVEGLNERRKQVISISDLPIPGITFDTEQVYLDELPLHDKQLSTSQIMRLSFAIALAMGHTNEKLKLLCIPRGESLDNNSIKALKQFLADNPDWQCFLEQVSRDESELKVEYFETV